jgi:checkpoint serine/threonine-protein kinase
MQEKSGRLKQRRAEVRQRLPCTLIHDTHIGFRHIEPFYVDAKGEPILYDAETGEGRFQYIRERQRAQKEREEMERIAAAEKDARLAAEKAASLEREQEASARAAPALDKQKTKPAPPSPTINTKAALAEVNDMFAKTLRFDRSPGDDVDGSETENEEEAEFGGVPDTQQSDDTFWGPSQASTAAGHGTGWPASSQGSNIWSQNQNEDWRPTLADEDDEDDQPTEDSIHIRKTDVPSSPIREAKINPPRPASAPFKPSRPAASSQSSDENAGFQPPLKRGPSGGAGRSRLPLGAKTPLAVKKEADTVPGEGSGVSVDREVTVKDHSDGEAEIEGEHTEDDQDADGFAMGRRAGGNRFANLIDAMTPITERTCEYTTFSYASSARRPMAPAAEEDEDEDEADFDRAFVAEDLASSHGSLTSRDRPARIVNDEERSRDSSGASRSILLNDASLADEGEVSNKSFRSFNHSNASFQLPEGYSITANQTETTGSMVLIDKTSTLSLNDGSSRESSPVLSVPTSAGRRASGKRHPFNPFADEVVKRIVATAQPRLEEMDSFHDLRELDSNRLPVLSKAVKRIARKSTGSASGRRSLSPDDELGFDLVLGNDPFKVRDRLGEGGFATVFHVTDLALLDEDDSVPDVALKVEQPANMWEFYVLCQLHARLPAAASQSIISPRKLYAYKDESFLVLEYCDMGTLLTGSLYLSPNEWRPH